MNSKDIKDIFLKNFAEFIGIYKPLNIPSIYIGIPDSKLIPEGVEVVISELPEFIKNYNHSVRKTYITYINDYGNSNHFRSIVSNVNKYFTDVQINYLPRTRNLELKNYPILNSATVQINVYELINRKPYLGIED